MKNLILSNNLFISIFICSTIAVISPGCSDEKPAAVKAATSEKTSKEALISNDSPHDSTPEANDQQKKKFEHDFAAQCIERELNNPTNKIGDADRINKSCECIASYIMKDLTDEEAEKFLSEHEHPQSLRIKFEAAAYECLQEKIQPAEPKISGSIE